MFTSIRLAPPRTCSSATSTASWNSPASISRRNFAEPVTFVRSPTTTKPVSGRMTNGSRPEKRGSRVGSGTRRGRSPSTARAISCVCSGVVPQQPPTTLTSPSSANARRNRLVSPGCSSCRPSSFGSPAFGWHDDVGRCDVRERLEERPHLGRAERAVDADDERLGVLDGDPERVRGLARQVAAAPVDGGERDPERELGRDRLGRDDRGLRVQRVEDGLDHQQVDSAVAQRGDLLLVRLAHLVERDCAVRGVLDLRRKGERDVQRAERAGDEARPVGRLRRPLVRGGAREPGALDAHLGGGVLERVVGLPDARRGEGVRRREVGAGREVVVVDPGDDLGVRQVQQVGVAAEVARVVAEALAAVLLLGELAAVDEDAPRPVEHEDPLGEKLFHLSANVLHETTPA